MKKLAIFASGGGSNAEKIIRYFDGHPRIKVALVVSNKPNAGVLQVAAKAYVPSIIIEKERFFRGDGYVPLLKEKDIDLVVLAGFLWKVPLSLITAWPGAIVNIHPALLPKYGGKGMFGMYVHQAVLAAGDTESGITIHYVDEQYDHGDAIFQAVCPVETGDTPELLAKKVQQLEHKYFPQVIEELLQGKERQ